MSYAYPNNMLQSLHSSMSERLLFRIFLAFLWFSLSHPPLSNPSAVSSLLYLLWEINNASRFWIENNTCFITSILITHEHFP